VWIWHCRDEVQRGSTEDSDKTIRTTNKDVFVASSNRICTVCLLNRKTKPNTTLTSSSAMAERLREA